MSRWTFYDAETDETYTVPINPDAMTSPFGERGMRFARSHVSGDTRIRTFVDPPPQVNWEFSGPIRTKAHHDALDAWAQKTVPIEITDHLGRTFRVVISSFEPTDRKPTRTVTWRLRYVMKTIVLEEL